MVYNILGSLRNFVKLDKHCIDNLIFVLHYKATVIILFAFSILVTSTQFFGRPIYCTHTNSEVDPALLQSFCWIHSTFSVTSTFNSLVGVEVPYPGIDTYTAGEKRVFHRYYQWVCVVLSFQAIMFYIPRYFWQIWEGGRLSSLVLHLDSPVLTKKAKEDEISLLLNYFKFNARHHNFYFYYFFLCELLNFANVLIQMYLTDLFLGGLFMTYGFDVLRYAQMDPKTQLNPMVAVFPRMTKCIFHYYGSAGSITKVDAFCLLSMNNFNDKIYVFLWFWFVFLAIVSAITLVYRLLILFCEPLRKTVLHSRTQACNPNHMGVVLNGCNIGDWFLLLLLSKNLDDVNYRIFIKRYSEYLLTESHNKNNKSETKTTEKTDK